ncbi:MAG: nucleotidyltransferase family protein [Lachnospiraceae bacterium]|nr:nucleotidyltransferase family protein [Lachnospiraceae bacterium]
METNIQYLLMLLDSVINDKITPIPPKNIDWNKVWTAARAGEVATLLYSKVNQLEEEHRPSEDIWNIIKYYAIQCGSMNLQKYEKLYQVLEEGKKRNISIIVFKGPVLGELYPESMLRNSCDIDIYVKPEELEKMEDLLGDMGFYKYEEHSKKYVPVYCFDNLLVIEAHCRLWEDYESKTIDKLEKMNLLNPETLVHTTACGLSMTTLGYEEHLVFLMFHLIKHISYNGCSLKTIIDIVLYINHYIKYIPKKNFWKKMEELGYDTFCKVLFNIGCRYFGLTKEVFLDNSYSEKLAEKMLEKLYGTYILKADLGDEGERIAASIAFQSYNHSEGKKVGKFRMIQKTLFPSAKDLSFRYMYARRHTSLVWIAWIHRALNQVGARLTHRTEEQIDMVRNVKLANQKLSLLKEMKLMEKD